jgi:hypothetical protein
MLGMDFEKIEKLNAIRKYQAPRDLTPEIC